MWLMPAKVAKAGRARVIMLERRRDSAFAREDRHDG